MGRRLFEPLEPRRLLAGLQNPVIRFDVDDSGDVTPFDAMVVINYIGREGARPLSEVNEPGGDGPQRYLNVDGDGWVTPLDALQVLNALHRNRHPLNLVFAPAPAADPNANGVVLQPLIELRGQTSRESRVVIEAFAVDQLLRELPGEAVISQLSSDTNGRFSLDQQLFSGRNRLQVTVTDEIGRRYTTSRDVVVGDVVVDWNAAMLNVVRDWTTTSDDPYSGRIVPSSPPEVAHALALVHVAMFDAINLIDGRFESYVAVDPASLPQDLGSASAVAAAATAAHDVAVAVYPQSRERAVWTATLAESLATVPAGEAKQHGVEIGQAVAAALLAMREGDRTASTSDHTPSTLPGQWTRTAPGFLPPLVPHWGLVKPLAVDDITRFRPEPPPELTSAAYAEAVDEVMQLGRLDSSLRTPEQTEIAAFWVDGGGTATPPGHWNRIAITASLASGESTLERARSIAFVNLAMADAGIASWDAKYHFNFWRPIDAIRRAAEDGNSATAVDSDWLPLILTPPFPAYTSGHSSFSGAAAEVLTTLYGSGFRFASTSDNHSGLTQKPLQGIMIRTFDSFWDAAAEASNSRVLGGIHFKFDCAAGLVTGSEIGSAVMHKLSLLKPN